jgi:hypothetical protein
MRKVFVLLPPLKRGREEELEEAEKSTSRGLGPLGPRVKVLKGINLENVEEPSSDEYVPSETYDDGDEDCYYGGSGNGERAPSRGGKKALKGGNNQNSLSNFPMGQGASRTGAGTTLPHAGTTLPREPPLLSWMDGYFWLPGQSCTHRDPCTDEVDRSCAALSHFDMYFSRLHCIVVCQSCGSMIPFGFLKQHIINKHGSHKRQIKSPCMLADVIHHIQEAFGVDAHQTEKAMDNLKQLISPLPGLRAMDCLQCRGCGRWVGKLDSNRYPPLCRIHKHERLRDGCKATSSSIVDDYRSGLVVELFASLESMAHRRIPITYNVASAAESVPQPPLQQQRDIGTSKDEPQAAPSQTHPLNAFADFPGYVKKLGWEEFIVGARLKPEVVRELVRLPDQRVIRQMGPGREKMLEEGLLAVHRFARDYIEAADAFVGSHADVFRDAITQGYVPKKNFQPEPDPCCPQ